MGLLNTNSNTTLLKQGLYKGFSSFEFQKNKTFVLQDIDLVNIDLLNQIYTQRGSRVMMPTFGTIIPELTFEPLDEQTISAVEDELTAVFNFDPRVILLNLQLTPNFNTSSLFAVALLQYVELNMALPFELNIIFEA
jgi:phage baseplate assembly protein W